MIYLLQVSICTAGFYLLFHLFYKDKPQHHFNRGYLVVSLLLSVLIPALKLEVIPIQQMMTSARMPVDSEAAVTPSNTKWSIWDGVNLLYWTGVGIMLIRLSVRLGRIYRMIRRGEQVYKNDHTVVYLEQTAPISSFLSYILISNSRKQAVSDYEWQHELTHIRQRHTYDLLLMELVQAFFWFNPILIFYRRSMVEVHEFLADAQTASVFGQQGYVQYIVQQLEQGRESALLHTFYSLFKKRLQMMHSAAKISRWTWLLTFPLILTALFAFTFETYPVPVSSEDSLALDTLPSSAGIEMLDTIITFDPNTMEETIEVKVRQVSDDTDRMRGIDTVFVFDPNTYEETAIIINHDLGTRDTIQ